jgi:hypothetical protein
VRVPLPSKSGTEVLAVGRVGTTDIPASVAVFDLSSSENLSGSLPDASGDADLEALVYPATPSALGLAVGMLSYDPAGSLLPTAPRPDAFALSVRGGKAGAWTSISSSVRTRDFRVHCISPSLETVVAVPLASISAAAVQNQEQGALLASGFDSHGTRAFVAINGDQTNRVASELDGASVDPATIPGDAAWAEPDQVWLVAEDGLLGRHFTAVGSFFEPAHQIPLPFTLSSTPGCVAIDGDTIGTFELYVARGGELARWSGPDATSHWTRLFTRAAPALPSGHCAVVREGFGRAATLGDDLGSVRRVSVAATTTPAITLETVLSSTSGDEIRALALTAAAGLVAGTARGRLYSREPTGWTVIASAPDFEIDWIADLSSIGGGILLAQKSGKLLEFRHAEGMCAIQDVGAPIDTAPLILTTARRVVVLGHDTAGGSARTLVVH